MKIKPFFNWNFLFFFIVERIDESLISVKNLDKKYLIGSNRKLKLFGWKPKYNLLSGIKKTIKLNNSGR